MRSIGRPSVPAMSSYAIWMPRDSNSAIPRLCGEQPELQCDAVHAVTQSGGLRPVIEDVSKMTATTAAMNLSAHFEQTPIYRGLDRVRQGSVEARPARSTLKFRVGGEK